MINRLKSLKYLPVLVVLAPVCAGLFMVFISAIDLFSINQPLNDNQNKTGLLVILSKLIAYPDITNAIIRSFLYGIMASFLSLLTSLCLIGLMLNHTNFQLFCRGLFTPLIATAPLAIGLALLFLFGPAGWLFRLFQNPDVFMAGFAPDGLGLGFIIGLTLKETAFLTLMAISILPALMPWHKMRQYHGLGYSTFRGYWLFIVPELLGYMRLPLWIVISFSLSHVEMAKLLLPSTLPTLPILILRFGADHALDADNMAAMVAILQILLCFLAIILFLIIEKAYLFIYKRSLYPDEKKPFKLSLFGRILLPPLFFLPIMGLALGGIWSFARRWTWPDIIPSSFGVQNWQRAFDNLDIALINSLMIGFISIVIALVIACASLFSERQLNKPHDEANNNPLALNLFTILLFLPLIIPEISLLFGMQITMIALGIQGTFFAVIIGHLLFTLPYVYLVLKAPIMRIDRRYDRIANVLGLSPIKFTIFHLSRILFSPICFALAVGFAVSFGLYLPTVMLGAARIPSLTTEAMIIASGADWRQLGVVSLLQFIMPACGFFIAALIPYLLWKNRRAMRHI